jgi:signal transduction histidine kinase
LTTPSYADRAAGELAETPPDVAQASIPAVPAPPVELLPRLINIARQPRVVQALLDVATVVFVALAFTITAISAEFLFHCVFVILVLHAFMFGLRGTLVRIGLVSVPLLVRADAAAFGWVEPPLELTEWPLMFVIAVLVAWMADMRSSTSRRYASLFRIASERLLTVEEDERRRVAGELHDGVGQVLTALTLTLDAALPDASSPAARRRLTTARRLADTALAGTRDLSHRMRPARLEERGLAAALADMVHQSGFRIRFEAAADARDPGLLSATATVEVYRIIQEALANAAHHSGARSAELHLSRQKDRLLADVIDLGIGFDPSLVGDSGIGLAGMMERARLLGGQLSIVSTPGEGTSVHLVVPIEGER